MKFGKEKLIKLIIISSLGIQRWDRDKRKRDGIKTLLDRGPFCSMDLPQVDVYDV